MTDPPAVVRGGPNLTLLALTLILLATALAGCTSDSEEGPEENGTTTTMGTTTDAPEDNETQENQAPVASIGASSPGGDVPFDVNFTFNATDPDGDALSWTLDVDGDGEPETEGTALPWFYNHTFETEGVYNVTFTVSDGQAMANETLVVDATAGATATDQFSGSWAIGVLGCRTIRWTDPNGPDEGIGTLSYVIEPATVGAPFTAEVTLTGVAAVVDMYMVDADGSTIDVTSMDGTSGHATFTGEIAEGTHALHWGSCGTGGSLSYTAGG